MLEAARFGAELDNVRGIQERIAQLFDMCLVDFRCGNKCAYEVKLILSGKTNKKVYSQAL